VSAERPLYFPVRSEPLRMQPGLFRFGSDFGNGAADRSYFPRDFSEGRYLAEKRRVIGEYPERTAMDAPSVSDQAAIEAARLFIVDARGREGYGDTSALPLAELAAGLVEDFAVLTRDDRVVFVHACFPSGWRPERVLGQTFAGVHQHVPAFQAVAQRASSLVEAMLARGPYVRFVWTISADDELDHHPEQGRRAAWSEHTARGFLRVERQVTVPFHDGAASLFLIRTFLYDFAELDRERRALLAGALAQMPPEIARYKGISAAIPRALELLR
jgi:dimethylamine monooxygenase subunit A